MFENIYFECPIFLQIIQDFNLLLVEDDPYYYIQYTEVKTNLPVFFNLFYEFYELVYFEFLQ